MTSVSAARTEAAAALAATQLAARTHVFKRGKGGRVAALADHLDGGSGQALPSGRSRQPRGDRARGAGHSQLLAMSDVACPHVT